VTEQHKAADPGRSNFLSAGFGEMGRKVDRVKLRAAMRKQDAARAAAMIALGQSAWDGKVDLSAFADLRDRLAGLDARAGELSATSSNLDKEKAALDAERRAELDTFSASRKAVEEKKKPVDESLRAARSKKSACEQVIRHAETRLAAIAGRLAALDRDIGVLGASASPEQAQKLAVAHAERSRLVIEQDNLGGNLAMARTDLPGRVLEESGLAGESQKYLAEIAAIDAQQKAAIAHIDANLGRVRKELQGATQQAGAVQKDRTGGFGSLGQALYDSKVSDPALADAVEQVASIDRMRSQSDSTLAASMAESQSLAGATMAKFWSVLVGVPLLLAALGVGSYQYLHRRVPVVAEPPPVAQAPAGPCESQKPPDNGTGTGVRSDCTRSEGTFANGRLQNGKITYTDGRVREGSFVGGLQIGMGTLTWKDGRRYEGMFVDGRSMGPGVYVAADGTRDSGMFNPNVKLNGIGSRKSPDGSVLLGEFAYGKPSRKMARVKDGKADVVEFTDAGVPVNSTAKVETNNQ
jgi:hypothetical protein